MVAESTVFEAGSLLGDGRVEIVGLIGRGAMGAVYKGRQQGVERAVAVKALHVSCLGDKDNIARFFREAKVVSTLDHPNIVHVYAVGMADERQPYFVMEYLEGITLAELIGDNKIDGKQFLQIFRQVAAALAHAHEKGIVHRDIKPKNIVLVQDNGKWLVKLCDFGIARSAEPNTVPGQKITKTGAIIGSPTYMSPEQCTGRKVDQRSDFYSLGCVMYEAASGVVPFKDEDAVGLIGKHVLDQATPISSINRIPDLSPDVYGVIDLLMKKTPEERYQNASDIEEDLASIERGDPAPFLTKLKEADTKVKKPLRKKSKTVVALLGAAAILGVSATVIWFAFDQKRLAREDAIRQASARAERGAILSYFKHPARALTEYSAAYDLYRSSNVNDKRLADVTAGLARSYDGTHSWAPANKAYLEAFDRYRKLDTEKIHPLMIADLHRDFGYCLHSQGRYVDAANELLTAEKTYKAQAKIPDDARIAFLKSFLCVLETANKLDLEAEYYRELIRREQSWGTASDNLAVTVQSYAKLLRRMHRDADAAEQEKIVAELKRKSATED